MDFSQSKTLLDAWVAYRPVTNLKISLGQKRTFVINREFVYPGGKLQFTERSLLSTSFSNSGREVGIFAETKFKIGQFAIAPQLALTTGDGRHLIGQGSDVWNQGGLKYGGRLDLYPFGYFSSGNGNLIADLQHEKAFKLVVGGAASYNTEVSNAVGEGQNDLILTDPSGRQQLPDYRQLYLDILMKYAGFSLLGEYAHASTVGFKPSVAYDHKLITRLEGLSNYLVLGEAFNVQGGYATTSGYALDLRFTALAPDFYDNENSLFSKTQVYTIGLSKYFNRNNLKLQTNFSSYRNNLSDSRFEATVLFQIVF